MREKISLLNPGGSLEEIRATASSVASTISDSIWESMFAFLNYGIILIVELLLLPFLSAYILYKSLKLVIRDPRKLEVAATAPPSESAA